MDRAALAVVAFAAGAVAGGLFVRWYVTKNAAGLGARALGEKLFGEGSAGADVVAGLGRIVDDVRN